MRKIGLEQGQGRWWVHREGSWRDKGGGSEGMRGNHAGDAVGREGMARKNTDSLGEG